jgi:hypothetical protein
MWIKASGAECLPHPAYSPDLAPSDIFPFGYITRKPSDYNYESRADLLNAVTEISVGVREEVPLSVLESWVKRLSG